MWCVLLFLSHVCSPVIRFLLYVHYFSSNVTSTFQFLQTQEEEKDNTVVLLWKPIRMITFKWFCEILLTQINWFIVLFIVEELETKAEEPTEVGFNFFIDWKLYLIYRAISVWSVKQHFVYFQKEASTRLCHIDLYHN